MVILGIDPGIARMGWAIIETQNATLRRRSGQECKVQSYGCVETSKDNNHEERLLIIYKSVEGLIKKYHPDVLAIEELFFNTNIKTALTVGEARGVILLAAANNKIEVATYTPLQVKQAVTSYGRADKAQVGQMIKALLRLKTLPKPDDTVDALAVALTHAFTKKFK